MSFEIYSCDFLDLTPGGGASSESLGWFDPTVNYGGTGVPFQVIDGSTDYVAGNYVIASDDGYYDFLTAIAGDGTGSNDVEVGKGDKVTYDGSVWKVIGTEKSILAGWFDPTSTSGGTGIPYPLIDHSTTYKQDQYVIVIEDGQYDTVTGAPVVAPAGIAFVRGDRLRYEETTGLWDHYPDGIGSSTVDGGAASTVYLTTQEWDGGGA